MKKIPVRPLLSMTLVLCSSMLAAQTMVSSRVTGISVENATDSAVSNSTNNGVLSTTEPSNSGGANLALRLNQRQMAHHPKSEHGAYSSYESHAATSSRTQFFPSMQSVSPQLSKSSITTQPSYGITTGVSSTLGSVSPMGMGMGESSHFSNSHGLTPSQMILLQESGMGTLSPMLRHRAGSFQEHHPLMLKMKQQMLGMPHERPMPQWGSDFHPHY